MGPLQSTRCCVLWRGEGAPKLGDLCRARDVGKVCKPGDAPYGPGGVHGVALSVVPASSC